MFRRNRLFACSAVVLCALMAGCSGSGETNSSSAPPEQNNPATTQPATPLPRPAPPSTPQSNLSQHSVYFDFDNSDIKPEGQSVIANWARYLSAHPTLRARLEGNCDERGTREYNIGLGERRANAVATALEAKGVAAAQLTIVSYGKERPVALGHDEASWAQNRRVDIVQQ
jgi:peptidoglycan-associated lipoprotein